MSAGLPECPRSRPTVAGVVNDLIAASHAQPLDRIIVAGADQLEFLIALSQRGFANGACVSTASASGQRAQEADILIMPDLRTETDLTTMLQRLVRSLRPGGVLVIHTNASPALCNQKRLLPILLKFGFAAVERMTGEHENGEVWLARRQNTLAKAA